MAADVTLRTMGLLALSIWETLTGRSPKLLFHDDNQGMIGVVRSGRNPTMRHLERTHGIAITSLHEHFTRDNDVLMYEVTSKMAADIHTKGFKNPCHGRELACLLIYWTLVTSFRRNCSTLLHRLQCRHHGSPSFSTQNQ